MREALERYDEGFQLGGRLINNLWYADDVVLIATSSDDLQKLVNRVRAASEKIGKKGKVDHAPPERRWGAHLPLIAFEPVGG